MSDWSSDVGSSDLDGQARAVSKGEAVGRAAETPVIFLNAPLMGQRLGYPDLSGLDLLELWAFVHTARFVVPTPKGFARALNLFIGNGELAESDIPALYHAAAEALLTTLESPRWPEREGAWPAAQSLFRLRWPWAQLVAQRIRTPERAERRSDAHTSELQSLMRISYAVFCLKKYTTPNNYTTHSSTS